MTDLEAVLVVSSTLMMPMLITGGVVANTPSGSRLVSLVSTEQIATFKMTSSPWSGAIPLCVSVSDCNSGAMAMFVDAYKNAGYIEFALGFSSGANSPYANGSSHDGDAHFDNFYLVVELEDTTPDATPPQVAYDGHYTGVTSYIKALEHYSCRSLTPTTQ